MEFLLALNAAERLAREHPDVMAYQESLAGILTGYAFLQHFRNDQPGSEATNTRAVAIMDNLARNHPEVTVHHFGLGEGPELSDIPLAIERTVPQAGGGGDKRSIAILGSMAVADHPQDLKIVRGSHREIPIT